MGSITQEECLSLGFSRALTSTPLKNLSTPLTSTPSKDLSKSSRLNTLEWITCPLCKDVYTDPRVLTCTHTLCFSCIKDCTVRNGIIAVGCPVCNKKTQVSYDDVAFKSLPMNTVLAKVIDLFNLDKDYSPKCGMCSAAGRLNDNRYTRSPRRSLAQMTSPEGDVLKEITANESSVTTNNGQHYIEHTVTQNTDSLNENNNEITDHECEEDTDIKDLYKCLVCKGTFCKICSLDHALKSNHHLMVPMETLNNSKGLGKILSNLETSCKEHNGVKLSLQCTVCDVPICMQCKAEGHLDHQVTTLDNAATIKRLNLKSHLKDIEGLLPNLRQQRDDMDSYKEVLHKNKTFLEGCLQSRKDYLHEMVDRWYDKTLVQLDVIMKDELDKLSAKYKTLSEDLEALQDTFKFTDQLLNLGTSVDIISLEAQLSKTASELEKTRQNDTKHDSKLLFLLGAGSNLEYDMLGNVASVFTDNPDLKSRALSRGKLLFSFSSRGGKSSSFMATGLSLTNDDKLLVTDIGTDSVKMFNTQGKPYGLLSTLPSDQPTKAVELPGNKIAVACKNDVKIFDRAGNYGRKLNRNLASPQGIAVTPECHLVVSDTSSNVSYIHTYDGESYMLLNSIVGGHRAPVLNNSWYVSAGENGHIIVSDNKDHTIKIFNQIGILVHEIGGRGVGPCQFFNPAGTCVDAYGNIIVADCGNNRIQVFSSSGQWLGIIVNEDELFNNPTDVVIDKEGHLVVLLGNGDIHTYQYLY